MPDKQTLTRTWIDTDPPDTVLSGHMRGDIVRMMVRQFDVYMEANKHELAQEAG